MEHSEQTKPALRRVYKQLASTLTPEYKRAASAKIAEKLFAYPDYRAANAVFIYISTPDEPETEAVIRAAIAEGKRVFVPKCGKMPQMDAVEITADTDYAPDKYGIPEPTAGRIARPGEIGIAVVPCLAADETGVRLGHGGGYYDAFLKANPCSTLCLCFGKQLADRLPCEPHDVRMDAVLTDGGD